jgi:anti-sigma regulatory factor (Ser/Thr protein kinase)
VSLAARYVPATADLEVGGDWYDVVQLPNGDVGVAIGDVAGHGLRAATTMGQLRMGLRAYAVEETSPARLAARAHGLVQRLQLPEMATLLYLVYHPDAGTVTFANAGHPPPLVVAADGEARYVTDSLAPPLGAAPDPALYTESVFSLPAGSTLLLFTDGLVERRGASLDEGLERLKALVPAGRDLDVLCDELLERMLGPDVSDDVAILALRPTPAAAALHLRVPAEPRALGPMRHTVRRWLRERDASSEEVLEILVACGEACANAVQHAYGAGEGSLEITLRMQGGEIEIVVRDFGRWREPSGTGGGRGLLIMRGFMDAVDVEKGWAGTIVRMTRKLRTRVS